ncbi:MAG: TonB-dependent receptor plug domain-containing protein [Pseudomonadota bacterium]
MGSNIVKLGAAAAATAFHASAALAATPEGADPFALAPEQLLNATIISASRSPEAVRDAPAAVYVITAQDIARAGATSLPEALRLAPGVDVARVSTGGWAISIRGFNGSLANKLLVLVDGREVYDPLFSGVYWDAQNMPLQDIARIEVSRGPGATLWGDDAVNGVINIITKTAAQTQGALVSAAVGDHNLADLTARYGGAGSWGEWRAYARYQDQNGLPSLSDGDAHDDWSDWRAGFRADTRISGRDALTLEVEAYRSDTGDLRAAPQFTSPYSAVVAEDLVSQGGDILARWRHDGEGGSQFSAQMYLDQNAHERWTLDDRRTTFDLDTQYGFSPLGAHKIIAGFGYRTTTDRPVDSAIITADQSAIRQQRFSAFIQDRITLAPERWQLTIGSKFEDDNFSGVELQPSVRLQWTGDDQTAWASASRALRAPSEIEQNYDLLLAVFPPGLLPAPISINLTPSPNFHDESVTAYEAGYRRQASAAMALDIAVFYNRYSDLATNTLMPFTVALTPTPHFVLPLATTNSTRATSYGAEGVITWRVGHDLDLLASYSLLHLDLDGPPSSVAVDAEAAEGYAPQHQASLRGHWSYHSGSAFDVTLYSVSSLPGYQVPAYVRLDLRWATRLADHVEFEIVGQNLGDDAHREFSAPTDLAATQVERSVFGRLTWHL